MRDVKFRAWDEIGKQWIYIDLMGLVTNQLERQGFNILRIGNWCRYTGLKDRNGVEIYQGDIVQFEDDMDTVGHVWWQPNAAYFAIDWSHGKAQFKENEPKIQHSRQFEVIGNVHENPELLQK